MSKKFRFLVAGDIMLDHYTYVSSTRTAPEAPIPVWDEYKTEVRLGGAANVANNIRALGGQDVHVQLFGIASLNDSKMISHAGIDTRLCTGHETMVKNRYVKETGEYLFRHDNFKRFSDSSLSSLKSFSGFIDQSRFFDAVIISDYDKGTIDEEIFAALRNASDTIIVDSKRVDLSIFKGATLLKVNESEYSTQISKAPYRCVEELFQFVVVTKGSKGAELREAVPYSYSMARQAMKMYEDNSKPFGQSTEKFVLNCEQFPVDSVVAKDVTGCGDTHTAAMAFSLVKNRDVRAAVKFGNACAQSVVQKFGTSVVSVP